MGTKTQPQPQKGEFQQNLIQINNKQNLLYYNRLRAIDIEELLWFFD